MSGDAERVLDFWLNDVGPKGWLQPDAETDLKALEEFGALWDRGLAGELGSWISHPESCLALIILLDQLPRAMFRATGKAYASDDLALSVAKRAVVMGHDLKLPEPQRQFFYLPLMHSESLMDQERCVRLMALRLPKATDEIMAHARAHRDIIRQFGRFPYRNELVGRKNTEAEDAYLNAGGYEMSVQTAAA